MKGCWRRPFVKSRLYCIAAGSLRIFSRFSAPSTEAILETASSVSSSSLRHPLLGGAKRGQIQQQQQHQMKSFFRGGSGGTGGRAPTPPPRPTASGLMHHNPLGIPPPPPPRISTATLPRNFLSSSSANNNNNNNNNHGGSGNGSFDAHLQLLQNGLPSPPETHSFQVSALVIMQFLSKRNKREKFRFSGFGFAIQFERNSASAIGMRHFASASRGMPLHTAQILVGGVGVIQGQVDDLQSRAAKNHIESGFSHDDSGFGGFDGF